MVQVIDEKPLFVPLKREYFNEFLRGEKTVEYREYTKRWDERNCYIGRPVTLSLGYGKQHRVTGCITSYNVYHINEVPQAKEVYGDRDINIAAIGIDIGEQK